MATKRKAPEERRMVYVILKWVLDIVVAAGIAAFLIKAMGEQMTIVGSSMEPQLGNNDKVLIDQISYHFKPPERFDLVIFTSKEEKKLSLKRIIGLPGETVQIKDGDIFINGQKLLEANEEEKILNAGVAQEAISLGEDEYFVLGDNRNNSEDSRFETIGNIRKQNIVGRAWLRVTNLNVIGFLH